MSMVTLFLSLVGNKTQWDPPLRQGGPVLKLDPMAIISEGVNFFCR